MTEIRTCEDPPDDVAAFIRRIWRIDYGGRTPILDWDGPYFDWQVFAGPGDYRLAAYDGGRLVATIFFEEFPFEFRGEPVRGSLGSWISIDPEYRERGIGRQMTHELMRRHRERGLRMMLGFGATGTAGPAYWKRFPGAVSPARLGFWYRILDGKRLAACAPLRHHRVLTRLLGPFSMRRLPEVDAPGVRPYADADLAACHDLVGPQGEGCDVRFRWTPERLGRQLDHRGYPRTLVLERAGRAEGVVNWYAPRLVGRTELTISVVDVLAFGETGEDERRDLLRASLRRMRDEGSVLAMLPAWSCHRARTLLATGFVRLPAEYDVLFLPLDPTLRGDGLRTFHLHWR